MASALAWVPAMQAYSYPIRSRFIGAWAPDLRALRSDEAWLAYWALLQEPDLAADANAWRRAAEMAPRAFRRGRACLRDQGMLSGSGRLVAVPAAQHLAPDMPSAARRLEMAWALYGPQSRRDRARTTGIGYNSRWLSHDPYGPPPDRELALDWLGRTCGRGRAWARNRLRDAGAGTVLTWVPVWHVFQRDLRKHTAWLVHVLRQRNLPHLDDRRIPDWRFEAIQLPLFADALPVCEAVGKVTRSGRKSDSGAVGKVTRSGRKSDALTAHVKRKVNPSPVKSCESAGTSGARPAPGRFERVHLGSMEVMERLTYLQSERGMGEREAVRYLMQLGLDA